MLTALVLAVTLAVSLAAQLSPDLMHLFTRDLSRLRHGEWWRAVTPVLVQPSGWGQLVFNLLGIAVVGAAVESRLRRTSWALVYVVGGVGGIAVMSVWHPADTGGGSSAAVAALIGALAVLLVAGGPTRRRDWPAQLYSVFFVTYLTALALGGVVPSIIVGNASIVILFAARRAVRPATLARVCLLVVAVGGLVMTVARDDHGFGIVAGLALACIIVVRATRLSGRTAPPA